ncbi:MAG TPA: 3'(2'),5'-bisphosphate nucleotidase CysQ [Mucilaginibacter sp.]|jgi:3'(2'), 5'-bisphosphate nucleotidase|nr:3'(2'),5'-bisphosphate nucleotidase CysQ [Mucilaginibacter sp.]
MELNLRMAILAAIKAGDEIIKVYNESDQEIKLKSDQSPLTKADRNSHRVIEEGLKASGLPVLSEEGNTVPYEDRSKWELFWLVDPLDGTKEFVKKNGEFTVNIALISLDTPVIGVVYVPVTRVLYFASGQTGSLKVKIEEEFQASDVDGLFERAESLTETKYPTIFTIVASRSHSNKETEEFVDRKQKELGNVNRISSGSSIKLCLVAERKAHIYPRLAPTMEWDTAAAHAIAHYSDCRVYDYITGSELKYNKENMLNPWFVVSGQY